MNKKRELYPDNESIIMNNIITDMMIESYLIDETDNEGITDLMYACYFGYPKIVNELLNKGADLNLKNKSHEDCLILTAYCSTRKLKNSLDIVDLLIKHKVNLNNQDTSGDTALTLSCCNTDSFEFARKLIIVGVDTSVKNNSKETALFLACCNENINAIHSLCSTASSLELIEKFKLEIENAENNTATKYAKKMLETVELHLSLEKELTFKNKQLTLKI